MTHLELREVITTVADDLVGTPAPRWHDWYPAR